MLASPRRSRFTDEIFGALIALIFITEAFRDIFADIFGAEAPTNGELLALILALGTFMIALQFSRIRQKPLLMKTVREFLADFGPTIAIFAMTAAAWAMRPIELEHLDLDMAIIAVLVAICAAIGLPWVVAATVRSLNHVRSLATVRHHARGEHIISVMENRLTPLVVHLLLGGSLLFLGLLREIPMSVVFGLFLFMGIASLRGNPFVDRLKLWVTHPTLYPPTHYIRRVSRTVLHSFTLIQVACLSLLWLVKGLTYGVLFPLCIALLVPIRRGLQRVFSQKDLAFLDADENPEEEQYREMD